MDFSGDAGTSNVSLIWLSSSCCECEWWIWFKLFFLNCLGGNAGGCPSIGVSWDLSTKIEVKSLDTDNTLTISGKLNKLLEETQGLKPEHMHIFWES